MRSFALAVFALVLVLAGSARSDGDAGARALVDRAVKAMAPEKDLTRMRAVTMKGSGKFHSPAELAFTHESSMQIPDKYHFAMEFDINGNKIPQTVVLDGLKGWIAVGGKTMELSKDSAEGFRDALYALQLATRPMDLRQKDVKLSALGEIQIGDRPAVGVTVSRKGRRDVNVYYDKETSLPVKIETTAKGLFNPTEVSHEFAFSDHRLFDGVKSFSKLAWKTDGKLYVELEVTDVTVQEALPDGLFARP
jgi:hypothetical protein